MTNTEHDAAMVGAVAQIVSAYVAKTTVTQGELSKLITSVHQSLTGLSASASKQLETPEAPKAPAVSIKKSVTPGYIVCLEDGKKFKSLKRHLRSAFRMTPEEYRAKWRLPLDYPMVAPDYARRRSELAKGIGLGSRRKSQSKSSS